MSNTFKNKLKKLIKEQLYTEPTVDASGALIDPDRIIKDKEQEFSLVLPSQGNTWKVIEEPTISALTGPPTDFESADCP